jgi:AcrR family transcriptional regulator
MRRSRKQKSKVTEPKQERAIQSKQQILEAATKVFSERGFHGGRIDEIAEISGMNRQRIYAYFGSKEELYRNVLIESYDQQARILNKRKLSKDDIPHLTDIIMDMLFDFHSTHPHFWRLLAWENLNHGRSLSDGDWQRLRTSYIERLEKMYRQGQEEGIFRPDISFKSYLFTVFAATYFCFSNQITLSHLLDLDLSNEGIFQNVRQELHIMLTKGSEE